MNFNRLMSVFALVALLVGATTGFAAKHDEHTTSGFQGPKANTGTAIHFNAHGKSMLKVSQDFVVPDTPAPTWRIVDSKGAIYTLDAFKIKDGEKREIMVPSYIHDIAKVQVYCAWAQVLLGEASFAKAVK